MKRTQVASYAQCLMEAGWLFAAVLTPLYFDIFSNRVFEPDKATLLRIIALVMGLAWMVHQMELGSPSAPGGWREQLRAFWRATPITPWVVGLIGVLVLTTITSVNPLASLWGSYHRLQGLLTYLSYLVVFFLVAHHLRYWGQVQRLISVILATSLPVAAYGIVQHLGYDPIPWGADVTQRVTSSLGNAIFLAAYLIMVVPLTLVRLVDAWTRQPRQWMGLGAYGALLVIQLVAIIFTQSRGPWLGLGAALALGAVLLAWRWGRRRLAWGTGLAAVAAASFIILLNLPASPVSSLRGASPYLERLGTILDLESGTNKVRMLIWFGDGVGKGTLGLITDNPLRTVIGHGPESMFVAYNPYYPPTLIDYEARGAIPDRSHNDYLDYVVTSGLLGLAAYLGVVAVFFWATWRHLWQTSDRGHQLLVLGLMMGVVAHLVETFFGIAIVATRAHLWLFLGMAMGLMALPLREAAPAGETRAPSRRRDRSPRRQDREEPARGGWQRGLPVFLYVALGAAFFGLAPRPEIAQVALAQPPLVGLITLFWLLLGLLLVAWWLRAPPLSLSPQAPPPRRWLYLPLIAASAYLTYLLIGMVVADIYFKAGQEYDRAGQYQRTYPLYLGAVSWGIPQDIYFSFLGGYYIRLAQQTGSLGPPEGGTGPPIKIETVSDLFSPAMSQPWLLEQEELLGAGRVALTAAQRANPLNPDNGQNLGRFYALWGSLAPDDETRSERFGQANAYYGGAARMRPTTSALFAEWGYALFVAEADAEAEAKLNRALELEPSYAPAWALLGELRLEQGRPKEAAGFFRQTANVMAALGIDSMPVLWGKTYKIEDLLRQAEALEASPS